MLLIRGARVLTLDDGDTEYPAADILVAEGVIQAIAPRLDAGGATVIEAAGHLAMPGLVNGHFHSQQNLMPGTVRSMPLELFMLQEVPPPGVPGPSPELVRLLTLLGAVEMLQGGVTAVHDDAFHNPGPTRPGIDAMMGAYAESGLRATVTINHPNIPEPDKYPYLAELLPADILAGMRAEPLADADTLMDLYAWFHGRWHGAEAGRLRIGVANSAPQRVTPEYFRRLSAFSREHDLPFTVHVLETKLQRVFGQEVLGQSLVQYVHGLGLLDPRMLVVHAVWVDAADMALLAAAGCTVAHNPVCNLRLGSGIMPYRSLADHGIPIALGSDERSADDSTDMWGVLKTAGLVHQVTDPDWATWPQPGELLRAVTQGGARGMGRPGQGCLRPGAEADLILLDLDTLPFTPLNDLPRQVVYSAHRGCVALTMVAGRVVMRHGRVLTVDEAALRAEIRARQGEIDRVVRATQDAAARLLPYYDAMYRRAAAVDVGFTRWGECGMRILVANGNTTQRVTDAVVAEARRHAAPGTEIVGATAAFGVAIVSTAAENTVAGHAVLDLLARHADQVDAAILAISFDTALEAAQELMPFPVLGMTAAALHTACLLGRRFGLVTFGAGSRGLYLDLVQAGGFAGRMAGCETVALASAAAYLDTARLEAAVLEAATRLREQGAASVVIAGAATAGMAGRLRGRAPVPMLDGMECAIRLAETLVAMQLRPAPLPALPKDTAPTGIGEALAAALHRTAQG